MLVDEFEVFVFAVTDSGLTKVLEGFNKVAFDGVKLKETKNSITDIIVICRTNHAKQTMQQLAIIHDEL
jgi:hypothetical protein